MVNELDAARLCRQVLVLKQSWKGQTSGKSQSDVQNRSHDTAETRNDVAKTVQPSRCGGRSDRDCCRVCGRSGRCGRDTTTTVNFPRRLLHCGFFLDRDRGNVFLTQNNGLWGETARYVFLTASSSTAPPPTREATTRTTMATSSSATSSSTSIKGFAALNVYRKVALVRSSNDTLTFEDDTGRLQTVSDFGDAASTSVSVCRAPMNMFVYIYIY